MNNHTLGIEELPASIHVIKAGGVRLTPEMTEQLERRDANEIHPAARIYVNRKGMFALGTDIYTGRLVTCSLDFPAYSEYDENRRTEWRKAIGPHAPYPPARYIEYARMRTEDRDSAARDSAVRKLQQIHDRWSSIVSELCEKFPVGTHVERWDRLPVAIL